MHLILLNIVLSFFLSIAIILNEQGGDLLTQILAYFLAYYLWSVWWGMQLYFERPLACWRDEVRPLFPKVLHEKGRSQAVWTVLGRIGRKTPMFLGSLFLSLSLSPFGPGIMKFGRYLKLLRYY
ncbi:MAG: hypothetical protein ABFD04_01005 [Syntrophomonas sp.]